MPPRLPRPRIVRSERGSAVRKSTKASGRFNRAITMEQARARESEDPKQLETRPIEPYIHGLTIGRTPSVELKRETTLMDNSAKEYEEEAQGKGTNVKENEASHHESILGGTTYSTQPSTNSTLPGLKSPPVIVVESSLGTPPQSQEGHFKAKQKVKAEKETGQAAISQQSRKAVAELESFLSDPKHSSLKDQGFSSVSLTTLDVQRAKEILWIHHVQKQKTERAEEIANQQVTVRENEKSTITMKYFCQIYHPVSNANTATNEKNDNNKMPLFIGLHGGGGCPARFNDQQWENHKRIYHCAYQALANQTKEPLLYVAPRAPTNNWNLWHEPHMDLLLDRLIANLAVHVAVDDGTRRTIDTNRVYISGYSAGGDGVYMLAPRMADRWAAASMMAGHPNGVSLRGVYNLPFSLHAGGKDDAYNRSQVARQYKQELEQWQQQEQQNNSTKDGYHHVLAKVYENKGHWLEYAESPFIEWMAKHKRDPSPQTVVWDAGSARHDRFYWVIRHDPPQKRSGGGEVRVTKNFDPEDGKTVVVTIDLTKCPRPQEVGKLTLRFSTDDFNCEDDSPLVNIYVRQKDDNENGSIQKRLLRKQVPLCSTIATLQQTLQERGDPNGVYSAQVTVNLSQSDAATGTSSSKSQLRGSHKPTTSNAAI